jgi:hypothetical protein
MLCPHLTTLYQLQILFKFVHSNDSEAFPPLDRNVGCVIFNNDVSIVKVISESLVERVTIHSQRRTQI